MRLVVGLSYPWLLPFFLLKDNKTSHQNGLSLNDVNNIIEKRCITMNGKDLLLRFILGGAAVAISYLVTVVSPWEILAGIFAAFPAVMITAVLMVGLSSGSKNAANVARGSVYGMIGCVVCVATVWTSLTITNKWGFSIILGLTILVSKLGFYFICKRKIKWIHVQTPIKSKARIRTTS